MTYVCYDNGAYMNTGIQRSSATPRFADTTTSPAGKVIPGKMQSRKDLTMIMASHHLPYVAQSIGVNNFKDLYEKAEKAIYTEGPTFLNVCLLYTSDFHNYISYLLLSHPLFLIFYFVQGHINNFYIAIKELF